jgi:PAS domain S-box-containing protein
MGAVLRLDAYGRVLEADENVSALLGIPAEQLLGVDLIPALVPAAGHPGFVEDVDALLRGELRALTGMPVVRPGHGALIGLLELDVERTDTGEDPVFVAVLRERAVRPADEVDPALFEAIVRHSPDAITVLDATGRQRYANPGGARLLGYHADDTAALEGSPGLAGYLLAHPEDLPAVRQHLRLREAGSLAWHSPFRYRLYAGEPDRWRWVETVMLDLRDVEPVGGFVAFTRDVTEDAERRRLLAESQERLRELLAHEAEARHTAEVRADDLAALDRVRNMFVSATSHELRTPLTSILAAIAHLRTGDSEADELIRYHELIERNALRLTRLVEDLLHVVRLESGMIELQPDEIDLGILLPPIVADHLVSAREKGVSIVTDVPRGPLLVGDETRLSVAIGNLVGNAVKFAPPDTQVLVLCRCTTEAWEVQVRNQGPPVPTEARARIFEPFYRADNATDVPGSGLGLAIAHRLVDLHGGSIDVTDEPGWSTVFRCVLPLHGPQPNGTRSAPLF